ncbi:MAG: hypothetical protein WBA35_00780, partial [Litorimonas sp.]
MGPEPAKPEAKTPATQSHLVRTAPKPRLETFIPHAGDLLMMGEAQLLRFYPGMTVKGISRNVVGDDQRYTEHFSEMGRVYFEGFGLIRTGDWYVRSGAMCYRYDDQPGREHCYFMYFYGGCILEYRVADPSRQKPYDSA